ncbi:hypothetical protein Hanom_Chr15g01404461 [Helianthus anomalus]
MRVVYFELSCVAVSGKPSAPLFCMFYKLISDGDWFTFAKRKDSEWKSRFIFVSTAMIPESLPLRDPKEVIEDSVPVLSVDEIVKWKQMHENPTRAFTFPEGCVSHGWIKPFLLSPAKGLFWQESHLWCYFCVEMTLWGLLQGDCNDVKFMVGDKVEPSMSRGVEKKVPESSVQVGDSVAEGKDEEGSSDGKEDSLGSLRMNSSSND